MIAIVKGFEDTSNTFHLTVPHSSSRSNYPPNEIRRQDTFYAPTLIALISARENARSDQM